MRTTGGVVLFLLGAALCIWSAISPGVSWDADGPHATPRFYLGLAWLLAGVVILIWGRREPRGDGGVPPREKTAPDRRQDGGARADNAKHSVPPHIGGA
jgi:drug/metabolite transporter (DMT)-like permease